MKKTLKRKLLISFANEKYYKSQILLNDTALNIGNVDDVIAYTFSWLTTTNFYKKNHYILDKSRGTGVWLWKPYIILETFKDLEYGDIVLYSDAGISIISSLIPLFEIIENKVHNKMIFKIPSTDIPSKHYNKIWTKRDAFILTNCDEEKYWNGEQVNGALSLWKKNEENIDFLNEWLKYLRDPRIITDDLNMFGPNDLSFKDHRHDQSVLSLLAIKYDFEIFRDPTQYGNEEKNLFSNSSYGQLFDHHRNFRHSPNDESLYTEKIDFVQPQTSLNVLVYN